MTLYESNYLRLQQIVAGSLVNVRDCVSRVSGDCDLHLSVMIVERYTTTIKLTYWFADPDAGPDADTDRPNIADPDLTLKAYHDARLVETVSVAAHHRHRKLQELALSHEAELDRRWRRNMMLNKWLDYLTEVGHHFT